MFSLEWLYLLSLLEVSKSSSVQVSKSQKSLWWGGIEELQIESESVSAIALVKVTMPVARQEDLF